MALPTISEKTPTTVRAVVVNLASLLIRSEVTSEYDSEYKKASFTLHVLDQDGERMEPVSGDLLPHITQEERNWLIAFMNGLRVQAEAQLSTS